METPLVDHLTLKDYANVYEPAEDTFLLLDALESDIPFLDQLQPRICVEIGSGSGVLVTALAKKFPNSLCFATDINLNACQATRRTARRNSVSIDVVHCNLADSFRPHTIDVLLFNPPYVVTTDDELQEGCFEGNSNGSISLSQNKGLVNSWAGGRQGRRVIDQLLGKLDLWLSPNSVFYLLLLRENKPEEVIEQLNQLDFNAEYFMERRIPGEYLYILKITRKDS